MTHNRDVLDKLAAPASNHHLRQQLTAAIHPFIIYLFRINAQ